MLRGAVVQQADNGKGPDWVSGLIARQTPGHSLEQAFYGDPEIYDREFERIFMRHWLYVGHSSEIPEPGQYFTFEIGKESVILVRSQDGAIRALINVCRHRGSRICKTETGKVKNFVCPYHGWSYGLDGKLLRAWAMPQDFDKPSHSLFEIACEVFHGLIFINFDGAEGDFDEARALLDSVLAPFDLANTKVAFKESFPVAANWKLVVENYDECYHCALAHPEFAQSHSIKLPPEREEQHRAELAVRAAEAGLEIGPIDRMGDLAGDSGVDFVYDRYALFKDYMTGSQDGKPLAPLLGSLTKWDGGASNLQLGHASYFLIYSDHAVVYRFTPLAPQETEAEVVWLVKESAQEGQDYDLERLAWLWRVTTESDIDIIERNQRGVSSRYYSPGPYSHMEPFCKRFAAWYLGQLA